MQAKGVKLRALRGAYLDLLRVACERLEVAPLPPGDLISQAEIYRAEAACAGAASTSGKPPRADPSAGRVSQRTITVWFAS